MSSSYLYRAINNNFLPPPLSFNYNFFNTFDQVSLNWYTNIVKIKPIPRNLHSETISFDILDILQRQIRNLILSHFDLISCSVIGWKEPIRYADHMMPIVDPRGAGESGRGLSDVPAPGDEV